MNTSLRYQWKDFQDMSDKNLVGKGLVGNGILGYYQWSRQDGWKLAMVLLVV
jgi:hypothetical protein